MDRYKLKEKVETFRSYEYDWDSYNAPAPTDKLIDQAKSFAGILKGDEWNVTLMHDPDLFVEFWMETKGIHLAFEVHEDEINVGVMEMEASLTNQDNSVESLVDGRIQIQATQTFIDNWKE